MSTPLLIAHRGESRDAPENTLAAIRLAWERGARAVEIDVHRSADGATVVIHDADTRRIGGPRQLVARQTLAELRAIDAGAWKHRRWRGERVPVLEEVLATVPRGGRLFVELKAGPECVPGVAAAVQAGGLAAEQVLALAFDEAVVAAAAQALPENEVCLLLDAAQWTPRGALERKIARARELGARGFDVEVHRRLDAAVVRAVHAAGLRLYVWTVNRLSTARRLADAGVDGITTDRCAWLRAGLGGHAV